MSNLEIVTGAGPVGSAVALQLAEQGINVRLLTRSGSGPEHPLIDRRRVDVSDSEALRSVSEGATAIYHCITLLTTQPIGSGNSRRPRRLCSTRPHPSVPSCSSPKASTPTTPTP